MSKHDEQRAKYPHRHLPDHRMYHNKEGNLINGVFDDPNLFVRDEYDFGVIIHRVSRMWLEGDQSHLLPDHLKVKWGTYPPLPERLKLK